MGSCPRFPTESSDAPRCLLTDYFRACDPPGVLTSLYKEPAEPRRGAAANTAGGGEATEEDEPDHEPIDPSQLLSLLVGMSAFNLTVCNDSSCLSPALCHYFMSFYELYEN